MSTERDEWFDAMAEAGSRVVAAGAAGTPGAAALLESQLQEITGILRNMVIDMTSLSGVSSLAVFRGVLMYNSSSGMEKERRRSLLYKTSLAPSSMS